MSQIEFLHDRADSRHVLACPDCRADARIAQAWQALVPFEPPAPVAEGLVEDILAALRRDRNRAARRRLWLAAAAALLFFFFAGVSHEQATASPEPTIEDAYASLPAPAAIDDLLPN
jgi:hypothetical protein